MKLSLGIGLVCWCAVVAVAENIIEIIRKDANFSMFYEYVMRENILPLILEQKVVTVFAPPNEAFAKMKMNKDTVVKDLASYHVAQSVWIRADMFPDQIGSNLPQAPSLYLSVKEPDTPGGEKQYYVNNALIIANKSDTAAGKEGSQLLYVIDEVLEPFIPQEKIAPNAWNFLDSPSIYPNIHENLTPFATRVAVEKMEQLFNKPGSHTFFMPTAESNEDKIIKRINWMDEWSMRGHIIPDQVLFTRVMGKGIVYKSDADGPDVSVELSMVNRTQDSQNVEIQSNTVKGTSKYHRGVVTAKIVRANIPVKNGVVHLIDRPLMFIEDDVWTILQQEEQLREFVGLLEFAPPEVTSSLRGLNKKTVFAPSNEAILLSKDKINDLKGNQSAVGNLIRMHIINEQEITSYDVQQQKQGDGVMSANLQKKLYLRAYGDERRRMFTVEGGGVNSTAIMADLGATNGIVHIIDRVLDMPYLTVYSKMKSDPDFHYMFNMGVHNNFNEQLAMKQKRFTFFIPDQIAWDKVKRLYPSEYRQLTMPEFKANAETILRRHLIVGKELTAEKLVALKEVDTISGRLKIEETSDPNNRYIVEWDGMKARISRPDVQATNGVIHVLDTALFKQRDLTTTGGAQVVSASCTLAMIALGAILLLM